jgi:hypothetical protein
MPHFSCAMVRLMDCKCVFKWHDPKRHRTPQRKEDLPVVGAPSNICKQQRSSCFLAVSIESKRFCHSVCGSAALRPCHSRTYQSSSDHPIGAKKTSLRSLRRLHVCTVNLSFTLWIRIPYVRTAKLCVTHARGDKLWRS